MLGRNYWTSINDCPNPQLQDRSPSFYERGFDPIKPVDLIATLKLKAGWTNVHQKSELV